MSAAGLRSSVHRRDARGGAVALVWMAALLLVGCGNIQVRPLATGEVARPAFALSGPSLDGLRDEALRLCPSGADVLRSAQRVDGSHAPQQPESWYGRWWHKTHVSLTPASGESQLVVLCQPVPGLASLSPPRGPAVAAAVVPAAAASASAAAVDVQSPSRVTSFAPIGEGELRAAAPSPGVPRREPLPSVSRATDLRSGMSAAMPADAVLTGRPGPAPAAPGMAAGGRTVAATPAVAALQRASAGAAPPAGAASAPVLTY